MPRKASWRAAANWAMLTSAAKCPPLMGTGTTLFGRRFRGRGTTRAFVKATSVEMHRAGEPAQCMSLHREEVAHTLVCKIPLRVCGELGRRSIG
jgi:hypothetical protein